MTTVDKKLLESYWSLFETLSAFNKLKLIERLSNSLKEKAPKKSNFYDCLGGFDVKKSPEELSRIELSKTRKLNSNALYIKY